MKYEELPQSRKDKLIEEHRHNEVECDWWECAFEDFVRLCEMIGVSVAIRSRATSGMKFRYYDISFDLGRGSKVAFVSSYRHEPKGYAAVKENYPEFLSELDDMLVLQATRRLNGLEYISGRSTMSGQENQMSEIAEDYFDFYDPASVAQFRHAEKVFDEFIGSLGQWLYKNLEAEYEYMTSDECIEERLIENDKDYEDEDEEYALDGDIISPLT